MSTRITLHNGSFEDDNNLSPGQEGSWEDVPGWTASDAAVYNPGTYIDSNSVSGSNVAYLWKAGATLTQTLSGYSYNANEQVNLSLDIGDPNYVYDALSYSIELVAIHPDSGSEVVIGSAQGLTDPTADTLASVALNSTVQNASYDGYDVAIRITKNDHDDKSLYVDKVQASYTVLGPDGIVDGTSDDDDMVLGYNDVAGGTGDAITTGDDIISAADGNDTVDASGGADTIDGGTGDDELKGFGGDDVFVASEGSDTIYGGTGTNTYDASGDERSGYTPELQDEAIDVTVGTQGESGSDDSGTYGDGSLSLLNSGGSATFSDIQVFIAGEGQDSSVTGGGTNLLSGSPTIPADDSDTDHNDVTVNGDKSDANAITGAPDGADGIEEVFFAQDGGSFSNYEFKFSGKNGASDGGDGEQDILFFDLSAFNDTFQLEIASENGTSQPTKDQVIFTNATSRANNSDGSVTVNYIGSDGQSNTVTIYPDNAEVLVYGDQTPLSSTDTITLNEAVRPAAVIDIDNTAVGTFTPADGSATIQFGNPGDSTISEILTGGNPVGAYQITSGDESGTIGGVEFQNFEEINFSVACFTRGTRIKTKKGDVNIENLRVGDAVLTLDNDYQPIRWIGKSQKTSVFLEKHKNLRPIEIKKDALGSGYPAETLCVSPQHRILVRSKIARRMFDEHEILVPANKLLPLDGVSIANTGNDVEYWHMMFERHEIVWSNEAASESLLTGPGGLQAVPPASAEEIKKLFPEICEPDYEAVSARHIPNTGKLMRELVARHKKNNKPLYTIH